MANTSIEKEKATVQPGYIEPGSDRDPFGEEAEDKKESLTGWKNPPTLADLKQDLLEANTIHRQQVTKIEQWLDNLNVEGKAKPKQTGKNSAIQPKLIRKQAEWRYAALSEPFLSTPNLFNVKPRTWEDRNASFQNQLMLNYQVNTFIDKVNFIDEFVRTAVDEGTVTIRCGWEFEEEEYTAEVPDVEYVVNPEFAPMHEYLAQMKEQSPSQYLTDVPEELKQAHDLTMEQGVPIEPKITGYHKETKKRTVKNNPTAEVCDFRNVIMDPTARGVAQKSGFIVYSFTSSLAQLKKDKKYKNLDKINITNNSPLADPDHGGSEGDKSFNFSDEPRKRIVVYEYWGTWDIDGTGITKPIVVAWVGDTIIRMEENPYPDKQHPFITVQYLPVRKSNYGEPDGALLEDNQKIIGAVTRGAIDLLAKSANGQTGMRKDMLDATNRRKFDSGQDYEFNANVDPRQGVHMHTYPEIPQSAQYLINLMNAEAESLTGVKSYSNGVSGASLGDVAAGVRGALDAASKRELGILRRLSAGIVKMGRKFISMNQEFLEDVEVIRVTNDEFVPVRKDDLAGNFDLELSISTAEEDNNKAQELAFMLQTMGNTMDIEISKMILMDIARLRKMPDLAEKISNYQPQPDPMQQEKAQLEIELLRAQIAKEQALAAQAGSTANLAQAKSATESVKQGNIKSDTDIKNLNFVEQESGVTQERNLQLHGEQARSNMQYRMLDHQLDKENRTEDLKADLLRDYVSNKAKQMQ